jgi:hypothetical protein
MHEGKFRDGTASPDRSGRRARTTQTSDAAEKRLANLKPFEKGVSGTPAAVPRAYSGASASSSAMTATSWRPSCPAF